MPTLQLDFKFQVSVEDGIVTPAEARMRFALFLSGLPNAAIDTVPVFVWSNTDRSRPRKVERQ